MIAKSYLSKIASSFIHAVYIVLLLQFSAFEIWASKERHDRYPPTTQQLTERELNTSKILEIDLSSKNPLQVELPIYSDSLSLHKPTKGSLGFKEGSSNVIIYTPFEHAEGFDRFTYLFTPSGGGGESNYTTEVKITPVADRPRIYLSNANDEWDWELINGNVSIDFHEEAKTSKVYLIVVDSDKFPYSVFHGLDPNFTEEVSKKTYYEPPNLFEANLVDNGLFSIRFLDQLSLPSKAKGITDLYGWAKRYEVVWKGSGIPDYEKLSQKVFSGMTLEVRDSSGGGPDHDFNRSVTINVVDINDPPKYLDSSSDSGQKRSSSEYNGVGDLVIHEFDLFLEEQDKNVSFYWRVERSLVEGSDLDGDVKDFPDLSTILIDNGFDEPYEVKLQNKLMVETHSDSVAFEDNVTIRFIHDKVDSFGHVKYSFTPYERENGKPVLGDPWEVSIDLHNDNTDPISLNVREETLPDGARIEDGVVQIDHLEIADGLVVWDFDVTDPDSHPSSVLQIDNHKNRSGAKIIYSLSGPDADKFTKPDSLGRFSFKSLPDFEDKKDSNKDNKYEVTVYVEDGGSDGYKPSQEFLIQVTDLTEAPRLVDGNYSRLIHTKEDVDWDSSIQGLLTPNTIDVDGFLQYALQAFDPDNENEIEIVGPGDFGINGSSVSYVSSPLPKIIYAPGADFAGQETFTLIINEVGTDRSDLNTSTILFFTAIVQEQKDPPFIESVSGMGVNLDGVGLTSFDIPINENQEGEISVQVLFNEFTDGNETFESVNLISGSTNFLLSDDPDNNLVRTLTLLRSAEELDYEDTANQIFSTTLRLTERGDQGIARQDLTFNFILQDVNEPPVIFEPIWGDDLSFGEALEEQTYVATLQAGDPEDSNASLTWKLLLGDNDNHKFEFESGSNEITSKNPVVLRFKDPPSFEKLGEGHLYRVSIHVYDQDGESEKLELQISLKDWNEPPKVRSGLSTISLDLNEGLTTTSSFNLGNYFLDEDGDDIFYDINRTGGKDYLKFEISGNQLSLTNTELSNIELFDASHEGPHYEVTVSASNDGSLDKLNVLFFVTLNPLDEAPEVKSLKTGKILSQEDLAKINSITIDIHEDADEQTFSFSDLNLSIYDPEMTVAFDVGVIGGEDLGGGGFFRIDQVDYEKNDTIFTFRPPNNTYGTFPVDLNLSENLNSPDALHSYLRIKFDIKDTPDPPNIEVVAAELDAPTSDDLFYGIVKVPEGNLRVVDLKANDSFDQPDPNQTFYWEIKKDSNGKPLYDGALFREFSSSSSASKTLYWDESHPNINYKTTNEDADPTKQVPASLTGTPMEYKVVITVREYNFANDVNSSRDLYLHLGLVDADLPPVFIEPNPDFPNVYKFNYQEGSDSLVVGEVNATDYDNLEKDDNFTTISYAILPASDGGFFEIDSQSGELSFRNDPDYENPLDATNVPRDNVYEVLIQAKEEWTGFDEALHETVVSQQLYVIHVLNTIEPPRFDAVSVSTDQGKDSNFSLEEHTEAIFELRAVTEDANGNLSISLLGQEKDGSLFEVLESQSNILRFRFATPPDYENPRDGHSSSADPAFNNFYQLDFKISTESEEAYLIETFLVYVSDLESSLQFVRKDGLSRFEFTHRENYRFVADLDVIDIEGENYISKEYPDLVIVSEDGAFYAPNSWEQNTTESLYENKVKRVSTGSSWLSVSEDFNNDGSLDVIVIDRDSIEVYLNDGLGSFTLFDESSFFGKSYADLRSALAVDLDTDGMVDLIVASPSNNEVHIFQNRKGAPAFKEFGSLTKRLKFGEDLEGEGTSDHNVTNPQLIGVSDIDGDSDLDLILVDSQKGEVVWLENLGLLDFVFGGRIVGPDNFLEALADDGLDVSSIDSTFNGISSIELMDLDQVGNLGNPFACRDLLIGAKHGIYIAINDGYGGFNLRVVSRYGIESSGFDGTQTTGLQVRPLDLGKDAYDPYTDFIYLTSSGHVPFFVLQSSSGEFDRPRELFSTAENNNLSDSERMETPNLIELYSTGDEQFVIVSDSSDKYIYLFQKQYRNEHPWVQFSAPKIMNLNTIPLGGNTAKMDQVRHISIADLDRKSNFVKFFLGSPGSPGTGDDAVDFDQVMIESEGKLVFAVPPDYESGTGSGYDENEYHLSVTAYIGDNHDQDPSEWVAYQTQNIVVKVWDANDPPVLKEFTLPDNSPVQDGRVFSALDGAYLSITHPENVLEVFNLITFDNQESETVLKEGASLSIIQNSQSDGDLFEIDPQTGRLSFKSDYVLFNQDAEPSLNQRGLVNFSHLPSAGDEYEIWVRVTDDQGAFDEQKVRIEVVSGASLPIVTVTDFEKLFLETDEDVPVYLEDIEELVTSDELLHFDIYPHLGMELGDARLISNTNDGKINLEYIPDANRSGTDQVFLTISNGSGALYCVAIEVQVNPVPDPPVSLTYGPIVVEENQKKVVQLKAYDGDEEDHLSWYLENADDPTFKIVNQVLYFRNGPDYESPPIYVSDNKYTAELVLSDKEHNVSISLEVHLENLADSRPVASLVWDQNVSILAWEQNNTTLTSSQENLIKVYEGLENGTSGVNYSFIARIDAVDPDNLDNPTVILTGGADKDLFVIDDKKLMVSSNGILDYENRRDNNQDNLYELVIDIADSKFVASYNVLVQVLDRDETPPEFITGSLDNNYEIMVKENQTFVIQTIANDKEDSKLEYRVVGGGEESFFKIDRLSGVLEFLEAQNFEIPADGNGDGRYEVIIQVTDGTHLVNQTIIARLVDANDAPQMVLSNYVVTEDSSISEDFNFLDEDGDIPSFHLQSNSSNGSVSISSNGFTYTPNQNFFGEDSFLVSLSDGYSSRTQTITLDVTAVNDPPIAEDDFHYFYHSDRTVHSTAFIDVLSNDQTGPDSPTEKNSYQVDGIYLSTTKGIISNSTTGNGVLEYRPSLGFMGEDTFQYRLIDQGLVDLATVRVWVATNADLPNWTNLMKFGAYYSNPNLKGNNWIYHTELGWVYVNQLDQLLTSTWIWHETIGWFWTGDKYFKWIYHNGLEQWLYWEKSSKNSDVWFLRTQGGVVYYEKDFIRMRVRDEVIEILPDLAGLSDYVYAHSFFTLSDKKLILRELALRGNSPILNRILQFDFSY